MNNQIICILAATVLVSACDTRNFGNARSKGPDEFSVVPTKPLEQPESYNILPEPTPGQANRVDINPGEEAVEALGGNPELLNDGRLRSGEQGLVATASRYGVDPDIRKKAEKDDEVLRKKKPQRLLERWAGTGFLRSYKDELLDPETEATRLKRRGIKVTEPPEPEAE